MPTDPTTLSSEDLRAELARARAALEYAGAVRHETGKPPRILVSYADPTLLSRFKALSLEVSRRASNP